jgi:signal transduction histidine kinase
MISIQSVKNFLYTQWRAPQELNPSLDQEWRLIAIRWLALAFVTPTLWLAQLPMERTVAAYGVLVLAVVLNSFYRHLILHSPSVLSNGFITSLGDVGLHIAMIMIGGGFGSPFYFLLFSVSISVAMRYGYGPSLVAFGAVFTLDALEHLTTGTPPDAWFAFRSIWLWLVVILSSFLHEQAVRAEKALQDRLSDANLLNEATVKLSASLDVGELLDTVAEAGARLFSSDSAVLHFWTEAPDGPLRSATRIVRYPAESDARVLDQLQIAAEEFEPRALLGSNGRHTIRVQDLRFGGRAAVVAFALGTQHPSWATLACRLSDQRGERRPDPDLLHSFEERVTLAVENAALYGTLNARSVDLQRAYADLATAHQELLALDEMKDSFLANVSHELRTPLSSIRSFSELLLSYNDPSVQQEFLQIINSESERLTRMVGDVLDVMKIESGNMDWNMGVADPRVLLGDLARTFAPLISMHKLEFRLEVPDDLPSIHGDRDRLEQVVTNLLNNAMKFTEQGSITLAARLVGDNVEMSVSDTGVGIAPEDAGRVFEKFQQAGPTLTGKPRGSGLGLTICREIVEHHGGKIWVDSAPGQGSTFAFTVRAVPSTVGSRVRRAPTAPSEPSLEAVG